MSNTEEATRSVRQLTIKTGVVKRLVSDFVVWAEGDQLTPFLVVL